MSFRIQPSVDGASVKAFHIGFGGAKRNDINMMIIMLLIVTWMIHSFVSKKFHVFCQHVWKIIRFNLLDCKHRIIKSQSWEKWFKLCILYKYSRLTTSNYTHLCMCIHTHKYICHLYYSFLIKFHHGEILKFYANDFSTYLWNNINVNEWCKW